MRFQIHGKQMDVGDALRSHVEAQLAEMISKYSSRATEAVVTFSRDRYEFLSDATVHLSTGLTCQAKSHAADVYESFEAVLEKMETQLRRYKRRLKNHHTFRKNPVESQEATTYVLSGDAHDAEADEPESLQPVIVAETQTPVASLSVGEAVMQMELSHANMLVFRNDAHGGVNVVYRRDDGNIGWIDPRDGK